MTRTMYESDIDRFYETMVIDFLREKRDVNLYKMPMSYRLDCVAFRDGKCVGFAEIKRRKNNFRTYPTYMIALSKAIAAQQLTDTTGLPCFLFVVFEDYLASLDFGSHYEIGLGGRRDRNDPSDQEPCAYYPMDAFAIVRGFINVNERTEKWH